MPGIKEKLIELLSDVQYLGGIEEKVADHLIANGVTFVTDNNVGDKWISASEPPKKYRDEYGELIPFLVCLDGTEYPFRAMYDGKVWGDGWGKIPVTYWMPMPQPPKGE